MHRFYVTDNLFVDETYVASKEFINHFRALRLKNNDKIIVFNGDSYEYEAIVIKVDRNEISYLIVNKIKKNLTQSVQIDLLLCLIANDKMDLAIQKAVELGVTSITPIITKRSQNIVIDRINKKIEHWKRIVISSCEQSGNNIVPEINPPQNFNSLIKEDYLGTRIILSTTESNDNLRLYDKTNKIQLLVGPEGGFEPDEMSHAINNYFIPIKIGNLILRSETAVIVGITFFKLFFDNCFNNDKVKNE